MKTMLLKIMFFLYKKLLKLEFIIRKGLLNTKRIKQFKILIFVFGILLCSNFNNTKNVIANSFINNNAQVSSQLKDDPQSMDPTQVITSYFREATKTYGDKISYIVGSFLQNLMIAYLAFVVLASMLKFDFNFSSIFFVMVKLFVIGWIISNYTSFYNLVLNPIDNIFNQGIPEMFQFKGDSFNDAYSKIIQQLTTFWDQGHIWALESLLALGGFVMVSAFYGMAKYFIINAQVFFYLNYALLPIFLVLANFKTTRSVFMGSVSICITSMGTILVINFFLVMAIKVISEYLDKFTNIGINATVLLCFIIANYILYKQLIKLDQFIQQVFSASLLTPFPTVASIRQGISNTVRGAIAGGRGAVTGGIAGYKASKVVGRQAMSTARELYNSMKNFKG